MTRVLSFPRIIKNPFLFVKLFVNLFMCLLYMGQKEFPVTKSYSLITWLKFFTFPSVSGGRRIVPVPHPPPPKSIDLRRLGDTQGTVTTSRENHLFRSLSDLFFQSLWTRILLRDGRVEWEWDPIKTPYDSPPGKGPLYLLSISGGQLFMDQRWEDHEWWPSEHNLNNRVYRQKERTLVLGRIQVEIQKVFQTKSQKTGESY